MDRQLCAARPSVVLAAGVAMAFTACTYRATDEIAGSLSIPAGVERIRVELENATLDVGLWSEGEGGAQLTFQGGVRMDAEDEHQLQQLQAIEHGLVAETDPDDPTVLVVAGPKTPDGVRGMIAYEGNLRLSPDVPIEIVIRDNGHVTMIGRRALSKVSTRRGDLRFEDCYGGVKATTGSGNVIAYDHHGDLDIRSQGGDMQAFVIEPGERLTLSTGKGTIQCYMPPATKCEVDARAEIGRIGNDFGFEVTKPTAYSSVMVGKRGGSKTRVLLRTAAGHIAMRGLDPR